MIFLAIKEETKHRKDKEKINYEFEIWKRLQKIEEKLKIREKQRRAMMRKRPKIIIDKRKIDLEFYEISKRMRKKYLKTFSLNKFLFRRLKFRLVNLFKAEFFNPYEIESFNEFFTKIYTDSTRFVNFFFKRIKRHAFWTISSNFKQNSIVKTIKKKKKKKKKVILDVKTRKPQSLNIKTLKHLDFKTWDGRNEYYRSILFDDLYEIEIWNNLLLFFSKWKFPNKKLSKKENEEGLTSYHRFYLKNLIHFNLEKEKKIYIQNFNKTLFASNSSRNVNYFIWSYKLFHIHENNDKFKVFPKLKSLFRISVQSTLMYFFCFFNSIMRIPLELDKVNQLVFDLRSWFNVYQFINNFQKFNFFIFFKNKQFRSIRSNYKFILNFKPNNRVFFNLQFKDKFNHINKYEDFIAIKNLTFVSLGMIARLARKKKSLKKNKMIKLLVIRYFKKLFVTLRIQQMFLYLKKTPLHLFEMLYLLKQPSWVIVKRRRILPSAPSSNSETNLNLIEKDSLPLLEEVKKTYKKDDEVGKKSRNKFINLELKELKQKKKKIEKKETQTIKFRIEFEKVKINAPRINSIVFLESQNYTTNKIKQKGRIKRKITKKIIRKNHIVD